MARTGNKGRPRIADEIKAVRGTLRKDRIQPPGIDAPPLDGIPPPPPSLPPDAAAYWREQAAYLHEVGILKRVDLAALEHLALAYAVSKATLNAIGRISAGGELSDDDIRSLRNLNQVAKTTAQIFRDMSAEFGFTPQSRQKIVIPPPPREKSLAERLLKAL